LQELFAPTLTDLGASSRAKSVKTTTDATGANLSRERERERHATPVPIGSNPSTHDGRSWRAYDGTNSG
jgi:hypothetical protein